MPNRLIDETSPYLLQHANNPVEWYAWGTEALSKAKAEDKPIFLSIGYAACHWCHVMAHESFEDEATAKLMNELFVNIKVDREERPDLDSIYMSAVVGMTGSGGWPMSVFLTPDGKPFYGGTYFPPSARYGMPAFREVLKAVSDAWRSKRAEIVENSQGIVGYMQQGDDLVEKAASSPLSIDTLTKAAHNIERNFDRSRGGWGGAPKFPQPMTLEFLIRSYAHSPDEAARSMIDLTLTAIARGGIYDQLGGGFHRYSTDANWLVPHFEKMLYDNSQLARVYLHAYQTFGTPFYKRITTEILDYLAREMTHPDGGFYSTQDADSEGAEGKFFVWSVAEVRSILGDDALLFTEVYGLTPNGNFQDDHSGLRGNVLSVAHNPIEVAKANGLSLDELESKLAQARQKLFDVRERRVKPNRDEKILSGWNGLMLAAFAEAGRDRSLDRSDQYRSIAEKNAAFLLRSMRTPNGRLYRSWKDGQAKLNGYLEDYACVIEGLLAVYQTTFDEQWFIAARELADTMIKHFT
ncbi:MAG TPA: thioredoxin domain-containing protein, partial [Anaerolineae bacterium]|nr:thioredoxin domain-containing protein [Anaerolineae bacterium]